MISHEILFLAFLICMILFGIITAMIGSTKGEGFLDFFLGFFLGPFGILMAIFSKGNRCKQCPMCKEFIHEDAIKCPKCQTNITFEKEGEEIVIQPLLGNKRNKKK